MECKDSTVIYNEDCDNPRIKKECLSQDEITESQTTHVQQIDTHFMKCVQESDVDIKIAAIKESWDPFITSRGIKSDAKQPFMCLRTSVIKTNDEINIKEEHVIQCEISPESQKTHLQQNGTYFMGCNESSDVDTKVGIKQEALDPNEASSDIKCYPEQPPSSDSVAFLDTGTLKTGDKIDIKQQLCWVEGTSADSLNEGEGSGSRKNETAEDVPLMESSSPNTHAVYSSSVTQLQENKDTNTPGQKCEIEHRCSACGKSFQFLSHLQKHYFYKECKWRNWHKNCTYSDVLEGRPIRSHRGQYTCDTCGKIFSKLGNFKVHLSVHDDKRSYKCQICGKSFKQWPGLKTHLVVHNDKRPYKCQICMKSFKQLNILKKHLLVHDAKRQYRCEICAKSFKRLDVLKSHLLVHDEKRHYKCQNCEKSFKLLSSLKTHLFVHDDKRQHKCQICQKSFKQLRVLKRHLLVHDDKRQYRCQICEKSFKWLRSLKRHLLVHDDNR